MAKLTEEDVKQRLITPALVELAGWSRDQLFMEAITPGQVIVQGTRTRRGPIGKADYVLVGSKARKPLAVVEAKDQEHSVDAGLQQAMEYAVKLDAPFAYSSNGKGFVEHDFFTGVERELRLGDFPSEASLWKRFLRGKGLGARAAEVVAQPYYFDPYRNKEPRYYQRVAIDRTVEAIAKGNKRLLLVMATGTGKTFTAFQIIWRLLEAGAVKRVLYLADRNVLIDQTITGDFQPFGNRITKVGGRTLDSSYEVYTSLYHQLAGEEGNEPFRQFMPSFFDLVVVDECHRGSAREESLWRRVLDYFSDAVHLGLTATPKETKEVSNITYFGEPLYTYSLREGIEDGFLAPYKVLRVGLNIDLENWRPYQGQTDIDGLEIEDREYNVKDFDKNLIIDDRMQAVAKYVSSWLRKYGRDSKTIVFCVDIEHAERMRRALANENADMMTADWRYVMRITGDDETGKSQLDNFADPSELHPTVVTTSKLLTTGVDVRTIKLIVLESNIASMTEFKQIIGRGTRLAPEHGKNFFTIMDFRGSTRLFADPEFDGDPAVIINVPGPIISDDEIVVSPNWDPGEDEPTGEIPLPGPSGETQEVQTLTWLPDAEKDKKVRVQGVDVRLLNERVQYIDPKNGNLITESIRDFSRKSLRGRYSTLDAFLHAWTSAQRKSVLLEELENQGVLLEALREQAGEATAHIDDFDLILHVAFDRPPLTKRERIDRVKKGEYLHKFSSKCQQVLSALLDKYRDVGIGELEDTRVLNNDPFVQYGSPRVIAELFGGRTEYLAAVRELEDQLYAAA
ncbi:EcoAI/FtnUII family type I restriction enzme subunit R [Citricoccus sp. I39-566]|uniref:EcoAI/FtnUII family type I restriction enzme subunit R n=1 Tax=Citricoccus sp. I39-566 TaxID=3073268 RepID=UPI00286BB638|nr:DEAD/DEAH box helicase family protein [Citricoccus sp. I39-566]WMY79414.1 DEAD/DEAH box helicase family protein [Citricoccus sp. I39-566]